MPSASWGRQSLEGGTLVVVLFADLVPVVGTAVKVSRRDEARSGLDIPARMHGQQRIGRGLDLRTLTPQSLDKDVVHPAPAAIHADFDAETGEFRVPFTDDLAIS